MEDLFILTPMESHCRGSDLCFREISDCSMESGFQVDKTEDQ